MTLPEARAVGTGSESSCSSHDLHSTGTARVRSHTSTVSVAHSGKSLVVTAGAHHDLAQVVLADKYDRYQMTYEGCHVFNPGSFLGNSFGFSAYIPARRESEEWYVQQYFAPLTNTLKWDYIYSILGLDGDD